MKYYNYLLLMIVFSSMISWCTEQNVKKPITNITWTYISQSKTDKQKIIDNLHKQSTIIKVQELWDGVSTWWMLHVTHTWSTGSIIMSNSTISQTWSIFHKTFVQSWYVVHDNLFSIKLPPKVLSWWIDYDINTNTYKNVFIQPEWYDIDLAPRWVTVIMQQAASWELCNPYNLNDFKMEYWKNLEKKWRFFTYKKNINTIPTIISYEKKYYSNGDWTVWIFNGRQWKSCFIQWNIKYTIAALLMNRQTVATILNSFRFL